METKPMGSGTMYAKSGKSSRHRIKENATCDKPWAASGSTSYPPKVHQRMNGREIQVKHMTKGSGSASSDSYPDRNWQDKFGTNQKAG